MVRRRIPQVLRSRAATHSYLWLFFAAIMLVEPRDQSMSFGRVILGNLIFIATLIPPVYVHFYIFDRYLSKGRYRTYIPLTIATALAFGLVNYFTLTRYHRTEVSFLFTSFYILIFIAITTAMKMAKAWYDQRLILREIQAQQLETELALLKTQINPHFLFNTLNNLYGIISRNDPQAARGIATLSNLMRYMIHDSNVRRIELEKEIEQISRFIDLQRLRFSDDDEVSIDMNTDGNIHDVTLPPMLLLPFVENAFKHGISLSRPSYVIIDVSVADKGLHFSVKNSLHGRGIGREERTEGTGLNNVKRRLELLYGDKHELNILTDGGEYSVSLTLQPIGG